MSLFISYFETIRLVNEVFILYKFLCITLSDGATGAHGMTSLTFFCRNHQNSVFMSPHPTLGPAIYNSTVMTIVLRHQVYCTTVLPTVTKKFKKYFK